MSPLHSESTAARIRENPLSLSMEDVERLLTEESPDARIDVLKKVALAHGERRFSVSELAIAEQVFRILVKDMEVTVRKALADALMTNPNVPRDIVLSLSHDVDEVACIIIENSPVLSDTDLVALLKSARQIDRATAVARRHPLSADVSAALIETRNDRVIGELLRNHSAVIGEDIYQDVIRNYSRNNELMTAIAERPNLPITVVEKVIALISGALAEKMRTRYNVAPGTIALETEKTREVATLKLLDGRIGTHDSEKLVDQLLVFGRLSPSIILTSLCRGNLYFFETSLARLSNIPVRNAQLLIHDKGGLGFKALYAKASLPEKFFTPCKLLLEVVAEILRAGDAHIGTQAYSNMVVQKLLARAEGQNVENLAYIIALVRQAT